MKRSVTLGLALLLTLLVSAGCIVCPAPGTSLSSSQFMTYKVPERIPANEWVLLGEYTFRQRFEVQGATGVLNGRIFEKGHRMKTQFRYSLFDPQNVLLDQQIWKLRYRNSGEVKKVAEKRLQKNVRPGDRAPFEFLSNQDVPKDLLLGCSFNIEQQTGTETF